MGDGMIGNGIMVETGDGRFIVHQTTTTKGRRELTEKTAAVEFRVLAVVGGRQPSTADESGVPLTVSTPSEVLYNTLWNMHFQWYTAVLRPSHRRDLVPGITHRRLLKPARNNCGMFNLALSHPWSQPTPRPCSASCSLPPRRRFPWYEDPVETHLSA